MKQHITVKQLNELSDNSKDKLRKSIKIFPGDFYLGNYWDKKTEYIHDNNETPPDKSSLPIPSIGQMIKFLDEEYNKNNRFSLSIERTNNGWCLWESDNFTGELCDALWEAVKESILAT